MPTCKEINALIAQLNRELAAATNQLAGAVSAADRARIQQLIDALETELAGLRGDWLAQGCDRPVKPAIPVLAQPGKNIQVTYDSNPNNDRSESVLISNPINPLNMVGASKRFTDPVEYQFSLAAYATLDGGATWTESLLPPVAGADFTSDPIVTFDDLGKAYLSGLVWTYPVPPPPIRPKSLGMAAYTSTDGGLTWSAPDFFYQGYADKPAIAGDTTPASPHHGNVYAAWDGDRPDDHHEIQFARTTDRGATWIGAGPVATGPPPGTVVAHGLFPSVSVTGDGTVVVFFMAAGQPPSVDCIRSTDGGDTFTAAATVATLVAELPIQLPGGKFRTETIPTSCCGPGRIVTVAWPEFRNNVAEIYYQQSHDAGSSWNGPTNGRLLTPTAAGQHNFAPQLAATPAGDIGCAFYQFGPRAGGAPPDLIDVLLAVSRDTGADFRQRITITDRPWDPTVDAPLGGGFIGDYFGLAAGSTGWFPFWTDTRTGIQELFTCHAYELIRGA
ncbi:hypothetical protein ACFQ6N_00355 [Kitasatospora sp. NPDC056446]|uniref:hypothetical protein n=1 Tax=Kitasatospora sp. NPDC056446 TaxID=3345819 RepID=UPI003675ECF3